MPFTDDEIAAAVARALANSRDRPQPKDAGRTPEKYAQLSRDFRASARRHLREDGDLPQASNKAWGMVAETIKAVSAQHGGIIHVHRSIWLTLRELSQMVEDSGDADGSLWIDNSFAIARTLHSNFYEDESSADEVADGLITCEQLSERLYELFWPEHPETQPPPSQSNQE